MAPSIAGSFQMKQYTGKDRAAQVTFGRSVGAAGIGGGAQAIAGDADQQRTQSEIHAGAERVKGAPPSAGPISCDILPAETCADTARIRIARGTVDGTSDCSAGPSKVRAIALMSRRPNTSPIGWAKNVASTRRLSETLTSIA